ncbi:MAG: hypothetical protein VZR09_01155 [Candidatus Gastranaerophilaceae bacterium]|nr:hypothetical protein [Candidatus Gastranaerophilaceae bacterium]
MVSVNFISPIKNSVKALYNSVPSHVVSKQNILSGVEYIGRKWTSPQQRVAMGATAIVLQPIIDYNNKNVDDKTKKVSVARTVAKILVGTATGFVVRYLCIKGIKTCSVPFKDIPENTKPLVKKIKTFFTPKNMQRGNEDALEQYRNAMGTLLSLNVMLFTNFLIDAPLTKLLTNSIIKHHIDNKTDKEEAKK